MVSLDSWSQMLELFTEISIEKRFYKCYIIKHLYKTIMMMMVLV